jgi:coproporphyrinogen III oxidase
MCCIVPIGVAKRVDLVVRQGDAAGCARRRSQVEQGLHACTLSFVLDPNAPNIPELHFIVCESTCRAQQRGQNQILFKVS